MKRYLLVPFQVTPLLLVLSFSFGLLVAEKAGFLGIPLALILLSWFFKYCFVLLDSIIAGEDEPPVLSIEMVNPIDEQRPLALALLIACEGALIFVIRQHFGTGAGLGALVFVVLALPAHIGLLGMTRNLLHTIWPPALFSLVSILRARYLLLDAVMLSAGTIGYATVVHGGYPWGALIVSMWALLITFATVGGMLFEHRIELGIDSKTRQERMVERDARELQLERARLLDEAYNGYRMGKPQEAWRLIEGWLQRDVKLGTTEITLTEYRVLLEATSRWDDKRAADQLANTLVSLLLARRATGEALTVVERRLATNPRFQVLPEAHAARIAELAGAAGKRALQRQLARPSASEGAGRS